MVKDHVKRAALLLLLCAALLTTAFAYAPSQRSDISIRLTPPGGEAVQRAEVEIEFTDNTGSGLQTAHVKVGGASWREITSQLDRTDNRYRYVAEVTENGTVTARAIGRDGTVFEKSAEIDCFRAASGGTRDRTEEDAGAAVGKEDRTPSPLTPEGQGTVLDNAGEEDGKEFFTFKTPSEHVFYLVIDRQRNGENVYFLNAVTESDLMELAEKDREDEKNGAGSVKGGMPVSAVPEPEPEPVCVCKNKCVPGDVKAGCPVCVLSWKDCGGEAPAPDGTEPERRRAFTKKTKMRTARLRNPARTPAASAARKGNMNRNRRMIQNRRNPSRRTKGNGIFLTLRNKPDEHRKSAGQRGR